MRTVRTRVLRSSPQQQRVHRVSRVQEHLRPRRNQPGELHVCARPRSALCTRPRRPVLTLHRRILRARRHQPALHALWLGGCHRARERRTQRQQLPMQRSSGLVQFLIVSIFTVYFFLVFLLKFCRALDSGHRTTLEESPSTPRSTDVSKLLTCWIRPTTNHWQ